MIWFAAYVMAGAFVGVLAGLLGIGGGMTLVPIIAALFAAQHFAPDHIVHMALATCMASIVFTSSSSVREHLKFDGVDFGIVKRMTPGLLVGSLLATSVSAWIPQRLLALSFAVIVMLGATQIMLNRKPSASRTLPSAFPLFLIGVVFGIIAGLVSAGGAFLTVPYMMWCGVPMKKTIGTGAMMGIPLAIVGTIGYAISGWRVEGLPPYSVGFILLPALIGIVCGSVFTAPLGARLAHRLPVVTLKRIFACLLYVLAAKMLWTYW
ncbi:sulfite exporter TauE/SafE family protein [uncultured Oxalicibacterium sp.]|uniref:sulfite exporter TauE/SafE family protein n=1 Tax=uncultured Oxalicibacterium sp. TaxID=1168540 RepID=UPI0025FF265C|nr:sulfite exporter TauE/SafE family protein [uncultured Oxalicibacterium sp.]